MNRTTDDLTAALADRFEIRRFALTETEGFYFGLAVTSGGGARETIPFFWLDMQPHLEYRISELVDAASRRAFTADAAGGWTIERLYP